MIYYTAIFFPKGLKMFFMDKQEMNILSIHLNDFQLDSICFLDPKLNLIMNGLFIKILYATPFYTLNSIYLTFPLEDTFIELKQLELSILEKYKEVSKKTKKIHTSINYRFSNSKEYSLKISGIWESEHEIGLIYKWLDISSVI